MKELKRIVKQIERFGHVNSEDLPKILEALKKIIEIAQVVKNKV